MYNRVSGEYKSKFQKWAESLEIGDWVLHDTYGLCVVLLKIPKPQRHIDYLLEKKEGKILFWCTVDEIQPPHKIRWVRQKVKKKQQYKPKKKKPGRKKLNVKVNDLSTGIPIYFDVDKTKEMAQFPCVIVSLISETPFRDTENVKVYEFLFSFLRHWYAKPIQGIYRINCETRAQAEKKAGKVCGQFIAAVIRERYW